MMTKRSERSRMIRLLAFGSLLTTALALIVSLMQPFGTSFVIPIAISCLVLMAGALAAWFIRLLRVGRIDPRDQGLVADEYKPTIRFFGILRVSLGAAGVLLLLIGIIALIVGLGAGIVFSAFFYVTVAMYLNLAIASTLANVAIMRTASRDL